MFSSGKRDPDTTWHVSRALRERLTRCGSCLQLGLRGSMIEHLTFDQRERGASAESRHSQCQGTTGWSIIEARKLGLVYVKMDHRFRLGVLGQIHGVLEVGSGICTASASGLSCPTQALLGSWWRRHAEQPPCVLEPPGETTRSGFGAALDARY
jgi:hypothetical protein